MGRKAKIELSYPGNPGEKRVRVAIGSVFGGKFQGSHDVKLSMKAADGEGYVKAVAIKFEDDSVLEVGNAFCNLVVFEELSVREPFDGDKAQAPKAAAPSFKKNF